MQERHRQHRQGSWRTRLRLLVAGLAVCIGATAGAGTYVATTEAGWAAGPTAGHRPGSGGGPGEGGSRGSLPASARVAPLHRLVPPTLLVIADHSVSQRELQRITGRETVREVLTIDAGRVRVQGGGANMIGVDPSDFRAWTPPPTASSDRLWKAIAAGDMAISFTAQKTWGLRVGKTYPVSGSRGRRLTLGSAAGWGLSGVDVVVSRRVGRSVGLVPDLGLLINAPGANPATLTRAVREVLGKRTQVLRLRGTVPGAQPPSRDGGSRSGGRPSTYKQLYMKAAGRCPGLSWTVLAAMGQIESGHGRNLGPSSAGALGPMQFLPSTWKHYGLDGDSDGDADIMNPYDAVPAAAQYLCANGAGKGPAALRDAIYAYNHAHWYVREVLALAKLYG